MRERAEIEREYRVILEALAQGAMPDAQCSRELISLGFLEWSPDGYRMTRAAALTLEALRAHQQQVQA